MIIEPNVLGSVFHKTAELFYLDFVKHGNPVITPARLAPFLEPAADASLVFYVRRAMAEEQVGENVLVEQIVKSFFKQLLRNDSKLETFKIKGLETPRSLTFNVLVNGAVRQVELCGIIDRMDIVSDPTINDGAETLRIVDYKTNGSMEQALSMDALFTPGEKHPHYVLQTFLYALMVAPDVNSMPLMPTLFLSINMVTRLFAIHQVCQRTAYGFRPSCPRFQVPPRKTPERDVGRGNAIQTDERFAKV